MLALKTKNFVVLMAVALSGLSAAMAQPGATAGAASVRAFQNYDFTPGETILFADDFAAAQDAEFPDRWNLDSGQGVVNLTHGYPSFVLTNGNYVRVSPKIKNKSYLGDQ